MQRYIENELKMLTRLSCFLDFLWVMLFLLSEYLELIDKQDRSYLPNPSARAGYDTRSIF